jgi:hypothetical protein
VTVDRVLDWQLDLLDHNQLHTVTVYTLYNSQQLSLFSSSEDFGSNSATTAATNSYGVPCHYSLTGAAPLSNTNSATGMQASKQAVAYCNNCCCHQLYSRGMNPIDNTSSIPSTVVWRHYRNGPHRKCWSLPLLRCLATVINNASTVDCWFVALATVVNTYHIAYSMHVTISL